MRSSNIGGQAVLEGIMMRNGGKYSVAVRKPDGEIESEVWDYHSVIPWKVLLKIPFIRGIFNFVDSLVLGMKTLMYSASFFEEEEEGELLTKEEAQKREKKEKDHYEHYGSHFVAGGCGIVYDTALCAERTFETGDVIPCCGDCF